METKEIEEEFQNRTTDRANRLISQIFLYSNFVCLIFIVAHYYDFFNMSYRFTFITWALIVFFSITMYLFCKLNMNRTLTMYTGLFGVVTIISFMGTNSAMCAGSGER